MNLRDLGYLVALAEHKHFGRAADACFVSQPTLSTQIKKIEDELGVSLVERTPRNVLLTDVGREIAQRAREVLNEVEQIRAIDTKLAHFTIDANRVAMAANRTQSGEIGIALPDPVAMAVALDPSIAVEKSDHVVEIETASELTRGQTVVDRLNVAGDERNRGVWSDAGKTSRASIVWRIDIPRWKQLLYESLRR